MKARRGSAATLVGLQLIRLPQRPANGTWRCLALGDSCLFQVSCGRLVEALPLGSSADFKVMPALLSTERSVNLKSVGQVVTKAGTWQEGDSFFLLTDAIAEWFLRESERGASPWEFLTSADEQLFRAFVQEMRGQRRMKDDDVTALVVGLGVPLGRGDIPVPVQPAPAGQADQAPSRSRDASPPGSPTTATTTGSPAPPRSSSRGESAGRVGAARDGGTQPAWWEAGPPRGEPPDPGQAVSPSAPTAPRPRSAAHAFRQALACEAVARQANATTGAT
jgi:hypothetical protein